VCGKNEEICKYKYENKGFTEGHVALSAGSPCAFSEVKKDFTPRYPHLLTFGDIF
jgi:hypothetical protein